MNYRLIELIGIPAALAMAGVWAFRTVGKKGIWVRLPVRVATAALMSFSFILVFVVGCESLVITTTTVSTPIYSADHRYAVRVTDLDGGAIGGDTWVEGFSNYGFKSGQILHGGWKIVEASDIHWQNNSELVVEVPTDTGYEVPTCQNFADIKVTCRPSTRKTWQH